MTEQSCETGVENEVKLSRLIVVTSLSLGSRGVAIGGIGYFLNWIKKKHRSSKPTKLSFV